MAFEANPNHFITWLYNTVTPHTDGHVLKDTLFNLYSTECQTRGETPLSKIKCAKIICGLYGDCVSHKRVMFNGKCKWVYQGICLKAVLETPIAQQSESSNIVYSLDMVQRLAPKGFLLAEKTETSLHYVQLTGFYINDVRHTKEVRFYSDGTWMFSIGSINVNKDIIGLRDTVIMSAENLQMIFDLITRAKLCKGKLVPVKPLHVRAEVWSSSSKKETRARSRFCDGVLSFSASFEACKKCQPLLWRSTNENHDKENKPPDCTGKPTPPSKSMVLITELFPGASSQMTALLSAQHDCLVSTKDARSRRWQKEIIQPCLTVWNRSPRAYTQFRNSGLLILPSEKLLQKYKNVLKQKPGFNDEMFQWMNSEAESQHACKSGGIIFDEMSIQQDLEMDGNLQFCGMVETGPECSAMMKLGTHSNDIRMASHILQFVFLGYDGFRFPFAFFPTTGVNGPELNILFWRAIQKLSLWNFTVEYTCMDGANCNRTFMGMVLSMENSFLIQNIFKPSEKIVMLSDYSHVIKRVRNNIVSSGKTEKCTRLLVCNKKEIIWQHWQAAYFWDKSVNTIIRIHQHLTDEHIFLNNQLKMRNHLAEQVLDCDMLNLMQSYQKSLGKEGEYLESSISLLEITSKIIKFFRDPRPIIEQADPRLGVLQEAHSWFTRWEQEIVSTGDKTGNKSKQLMSQETRNDLACLLVGFGELIQYKLSYSNICSVVPAGINSDVVENFFAQQRATHHGANTNPTVLSYQHAVNSSILGTSTVSKKSNASKATNMAEPLTFSVGKTLTTRNHSQKLPRLL